MQNRRLSDRIWLFLDETWRKVKGEKKVERTPIRSESLTRSLVRSTDAWHSAIALVTAYEADPTTKLWEDMFRSAGDERNKELVAFALTSLCVNVLVQESELLHMSFNELVQKLSITFEQMMEERKNR